MKYIRTFDFFSIIYSLRGCLVHPYELGWVCKNYQLVVWFTNFKYWWNWVGYFYQLTTTLSPSNVFNDSTHQRLLVTMTTTLQRDTPATTFDNNSGDQLRRHFRRPTSMTTFAQATSTTTFVRPPTTTFLMTNSDDNSGDQLRQQHSHMQLQWRTLTINLRATNFDNQPWLWQPPPMKTSKPPLHGYNWHLAQIETTKSRRSMIRAESNN